MAMEEYTKEAQYAEACDKAVFATRMREAGLGELIDGRGGPRRKCQALAQAGKEKWNLLAEWGPTGDA